MTITNASGAVTSFNTYDEYGAPALANTGRFQFTGQAWLPEVGLYYYRARMYNPYLGRFMQTDPILHEGGMNLYAYVGNDPINATDPSGSDTLTFGPELELVYGTGFAVGFGVGVSAPTPLDPTANYEVGVWGYISGRVGYGVGFGVLGGSGGSVSDLSGSTGDITGSVGPVAVGSSASVDEIRTFFGSAPPEVSGGGGGGGRHRGELGGPDDIPLPGGVRSRAGAMLGLTGGDSRGYCGYVGYRAIGGTSL